MADDSTPLSSADILLNPTRPESEVPRRIVSLPYFLAGVLLPVVCFSLSWTGLVPMPDWQSGKLSDYASLFLRGPTTTCFYPLLGYSIVCIVLLTYRPERFSRFLLVRLGIYAGVVLALQYTLLMLACVAFPASTLGLFVFVTPVALSLVVMWLVRRLWDATGSAAQAYGVTISRFLLVLAPVLLILFAFPFVWMLPAMMVFVPAPFWALLAYAFLSVKVFSIAPPAAGRCRLRAIAWSVWAAAYLVSLRLSMARAMEMWASLPTWSPDCYVCTAAARGHPRVVKSAPAPTKDGGVMMVNDQLRTLKLAEIALREVAPRLHCAVRRVYDRLGPAAARTLVHPILADLAYLSLKPAEWLARGALRLLAPVLDSLSASACGRWPLLLLSLNATSFSSPSGAMTSDPPRQAACRLSMSTPRRASKKTTS